MKKQLHVWVIFSLVIVGVAGCGKGEDASDGTGSEVAVTAISGSSQASEGSVAMNTGSAVKKSYLAKLEAELDPVPSAWAVPACSWSSLVSSCSNNATTISFDSCSSPMDHAISISGSETFSWSGAGCCTPSPLTASSVTPCSFSRRTIDASGKTDPMVSSIGSNQLTLNTEDVSGYSQSKTGGFVVTCQGSPDSATCDGQREVSISGAHYTGRIGPVEWDHTVSTDVPIVIQGHAGSRKVLSGTVRVQNNLDQYTSITTVTNTLTHTTGCCFPTGGSVTTTFVGGKLDGKTESLAFGPSCGQATLDNSNHEISGLTLHHCL